MHYCSIRIIRDFIRVILAKLQGEKTLNLKIPNISVNKVTIVLFLSNHNVKNSNNTIGVVQCYSNFLIIFNHCKFVDKHNIYITKSYFCINKNHWFS